MKEDLEKGLVKFSGNISNNMIFPPIQLWKQNRAAAKYTDAVCYGGRFKIRSGA